MQFARHFLSLIPAILAISSLAAAEVRVDRLAEIGEAASVQPWLAYLERSSRLASKDADALRAEVELASETAPAKAPSGGDFRPPKNADRGWYAGDEAARLADAILSFQTPSGGWSKHLSYAEGPRRPGMQWTSQSDPGERPHYQATFDNGATVTEIDFLASVWEATGRDDCRSAVCRGFGYILDAQYPTGGWPQVYPLEGGYHDNITFNDDAMTNILELLHAVTADAPRFACVDDALRERITVAFTAGVKCVLDTQVNVDGQKTAWCGQYDPLSLAPDPARDYEPAALYSVETAHVIRFLMELEASSARVVDAIEGGLAWLDASKLSGISKAKRNGRTVYVSDPESTAVLWARFYDLTTNRPLFPGKDGSMYPSFEAMASANDKVGYDFYSTRPDSILRNGQKKWRKRLPAERSAGGVP